MPIRIARIDMQDGVADFTDHSVDADISRRAIYGLKGSVVGLSSDPASRATVTLDGSVDRYAPVSIKGKVNVLSATTFTDIAMSFSNIELPTLQPVFRQVRRLQHRPGETHARRCSITSRIASSMPSITS